MGLWLFGPHLKSHFMVPRPSQCSDLGTHIIVRFEWWQTLSLIRSYVWVGPQPITMPVCIILIETQCFAQKAQCFHLCNIYKDSWTSLHAKQAPPNGAPFLHFKTRQENQLTPAPLNKPRRNKSSANAQVEGWGLL